MLELDADITAEHVKRRLCRIDNYIPTYHRMLSELISPLPECSTLRVTQLAIIDWWRRHTDTPTEPLLLYLRREGRVLADFAESLVAFFTDGGPIPVLLISLHAERYLTHSKSRKYYDTLEDAEKEPSPAGLFNATMVDVTGLMYYLYMELSNDLGKPIRKYPATRFGVAENS